MNSNKAPKMRGLLEKFHLSKHPSVDFVDNRLPQVDPAFDNLPPANYDDTAQMYLPSNPAAIDDFYGTEEMRQKREVFQRALEDFQRKTGFSSKIAAGEEHSWAEVLTVAKLETAAYQQKGDADGLKQDIRGLSRKFHELQQPVEACIKLLPSISWETSLVCGGLTLILQAASRLHKMREDTYEAMKEIPQVIADAYTTLNMYIASQRRNLLEDYVTQLFVSIFEFLDNTLAWYSRNAVLKFVGAVFRGGEYGRQVTQSRATFKALRDTVDREADMNNRILVKETHDTVKNTAEHGMVVLNSICVSLKDLDEVSKWVKERRYSEARKEDTKRQERLRRWHDKEMLLRQLAYDPRLVAEDMIEPLRISSSFTVQAQDRPAWILQTPEVARWLCSHQYRLLEINGNESEHQNTSATSLFSTMLVQAVAAAGKSTVLHWFCGQHNAADLGEMLKQLIGQVLDKGNDNIHVPDQSWLRDIEDPAKLVKLLRGCVKQELRVASVFLVIDSVSFYEDNRRKRGMHTIIERLFNLEMERETNETCLKILLTSPIRCDYSYTHRASRQQVDVLDVPDMVDGSLQGLSEMALAGDFQAKAENAGNSQ